MRKDIPEKCKPNFKTDLEKQQNGFIFVGVRHVARKALTKRNLQIHLHRHHCQVRHQPQDAEAFRTPQRSPGLPHAPAGLPLRDRPVSSRLTPFLSVPTRQPQPSQDRPRLGPLPVKSFTLRLFSGPTQVLRQMHVPINFPSYTNSILAKEKLSMSK